MPKNEAHISIALDPDDRELLTEVSSRVGDLIDGIRTRQLLKLRELETSVTRPARTLQCGSCSQHKRIDDLAAQLEQERQDYAAMQRALDDRHQRIRGYQHDCERYLARIGELEDKLNRVETLAARWERQGSARPTGPEAIAGTLLREALEG